MKAQAAGELPKKEAALIISTETTARLTACKLDD